MESLNKTSGGQSSQEPIRLRREDSLFPPPQTDPRVPTLVLGLDLEEWARENSAATKVTW